MTRYNNNIKLSINNYSGMITAADALRRVVGMVEEAIKGNLPQKKQMIFMADVVDEVYHNNKKSLRWLSDAVLVLDSTILEDMPITQNDFIDIKDSLVKSIVRLDSGNSVIYQRPTNSLPFFGTKEAAKILNVHPETLRRYCRNGEIKHRRLGNTLIFDRDYILSLT